MNEGGNLLSIDPAVVFLQAVAFVILFLVLRKYLFRPLLEIMVRREKEIAEGLEAGERAKAELAVIGQERERVLAAAREEGREQVRQAVREGEEARQRILAETREEVQDTRQRARESIELERQEAMLQLRREVADLALLAARHAVLTPLDEEKHRQVIEDFIVSLEQR